MNSARMVGTLEANRPHGRRPVRHAYTLVEMLMATVLTLLMMAGVAGLFESVGRGVTASRAMLEVRDRLNAAAARLERDLQGVRVSLDPPISPGTAEGYFQYTEGPIGPVVRPEARFVNSDAGGASDTTVIDNDDMLMMTVHSEEPFTGRYRQPIRNANGQITSYVDTTVQSRDAEIAWFVRGNTLYRRVLLIVPRLDLGDNGIGFYAYNDISMHLEGGRPVANTLADLTRPENRFAHRPAHNFPAGSPGTYLPYHPHFATDWTAPFPTLYSRGRPWAKLGLPTLRECSYLDPNGKTFNDPAGTYTWRAGDLLPDVGTAAGGLLTPKPPVDLWVNPHFWAELDPESGTAHPTHVPGEPYMGIRIAEDVILTNVIGFDVKAWDPGAPIVGDNSGRFALLPGDPGYLAALRNGNPPISYGAYVDLNYMCSLGPEQAPNPLDPAAPYPLYPLQPLAPGAPMPVFHGAGNRRSGLRGTEPFVKPNLADPFDASGLPPDLAQRDAVYDTWSTHYENDGLYQFPVPNPSVPPDRGTNGIDDPVYDINGVQLAPADGVVDDPLEAETAPPYRVRLRGIRITIRVYEPGTHQVRQRTIAHEF